MSQFLSHNIRINITRYIRLVMTFSIFYFSIKFLSSGLNILGGEVVGEIMRSTNNAFVGLFVGMLATAVVQSSSVTTSVVIGMVGAGLITIENSVPLIMGANIGTSVTSTISYFAFLGKKKEYRRAITTATLHDFFNILMVTILFPIEYFFQLLSSTAMWLTSRLFSGIGTFDIGTNSLVKKIIFAYNDDAYVYLITITSLVLFFISIKELCSLFKQNAKNKITNGLSQKIFSTPLRSLFWGTGITMMVQSSSVSTSLLVPFVVSNKIKTKQVFPFLLGANVGTTLTGLLAALVIGKPTALAIALVHVLFNVIGALSFTIIKPLQAIPMYMAKKMGSLSYENRLIGVLYVVLTFYIIPLLMYFITK